MAVGPKEIMEDKRVQQDVLVALEAFIDRELQRYTAVPGQAISISYETLTIPFPTEGTVKALTRLYTKAGWVNVGVNTTHSIVTVTCPVYRGA